MIDNSDIIEYLEVISQYPQEELLTYSVLIEAEKSIAEVLLEEAGSEYYSKAVMLAAARVNYKIALINQSSDKVTSFKAGDVTISEGNDALENAKRLLGEISADCRELLRHDAFAFKTV